VVHYNQIHVSVTVPAIPKILSMNWKSRRHM